jgi:hypothetical protein
MTANETTNNRPSEYSAWHRKLGSEYSAIDIDYVEVRNGRIKAIIGVTHCYTKFHINYNKEAILKRSEFERSVMINMANKMGVKAYYVIHSIDMKNFLLISLPELKETEMDEVQYSNFLKNL